MTFKEWLEQFINEKSERGELATGFMKDPKFLNEMNTMNIQEAIKAKYAPKKVEYAPVERTTYTVEETAIYLNVSKDLIYKLVRQKQIPNIKIGARIVFRKATIDQWLSELEQENYNAQ